MITLVKILLYVVFVILYIFAIRTDDHISALYLLHISIIIIIVCSFCNIKKKNRQIFDYNNDVINDLNLKIVRLTNRINTLEYKINEVYEEDLHDTEEG